MARKSITKVDLVGLSMAALGILCGLVMPTIWWHADVATVTIVALTAFAFGAATFIFAKGRLHILLFFVVFSAVLLWIRSFQSLQDGTAGSGLTWFTLVISGAIIGVYFRPDRKSRTAK